MTEFLNLNGFEVAGYEEKPVTYEEIVNLKP